MKGDTASSNISVNHIMDGEEDENSKKKQEIIEREARRGGLDHPFSIESILNGTTKRRKHAEPVEDEERKSSEENDALPLNALEEFTSKTFSTMKRNRTAIRDEEPLIVRDRLKLVPSKPVTKKTRRKARTCFTNQQIYELERRFLYQKYLSPQDRDELSEMLNLSNAQVITWFQNRRAKLKRDIEEMRNDLAASRTLRTTCTSFRCGRYTDCR